MPACVRPSTAVAVALPRLHRMPDRMRAVTLALGLLNDGLPPVDAHVDAGGGAMAVP